MSLSTCSLRKRRPAPPCDSPLPARGAPTCRRITPIIRGHDSGPNPVCLGRVADPGATSGVGEPGIHAQEERERGRWKAGVFGSGPWPAPEDRVTCPLVVGLIRGHVACQGTATDRGMTPGPVPRRAPASSAGRRRTPHCTAIEHRRAHPAPAREPGPVEAPCATPATLDRPARRAQTRRQPAAAVAAGRRRRRAVQSHCDFAPSRSWAGRGRSSSRTRWSRQQLRSRLRGSAMGRDGARTSRTSHRPQHPLVAATGPPRGCANGIARRRRRGGSVCLSASSPLLRAPIAPAGRAVRLLARRRAGHRRDVCQCEPRTFCATPGW